LSFTFSLALSRLEIRRDMIVAEANALDATRSYTQLLDAQGRASVEPILREYIQARVQWSEAFAGREMMEPTRRLQAELWTAVGKAVNAQPSAPTSVRLLEATRRSFDLAAARLSGRSTHIPARVLEVLLLYITIVVVVLGQVSATRDGLHRGSTWMLLVLLTLTLVIILDLDRTGTGVIMNSQQPLTDLRAALPQ
jgi:hypothetical protein